jgi:hypothetical protein
LACDLPVFFFVHDGDDNDRRLERLHFVGMHVHGRPCDGGENCRNLKQSFVLEMIFPVRAT